MGIIVDDAIVVIENTYRIFHAEDISIYKAAKKASAEVAGPVLAGTLTTVAPFFPLLIWPGIVGEFMKYLPWTLIIVLFSSLLVAFVMNPVFAVSFMKKDTVKQAQKSVRPYRKLILLLLIAAVFCYIAGWFFGGNLLIFLILLIFINIYLFTPAITYFQEKMLPRFMHFYRGSLRYAIRGRNPYLFFFGTTGLLIFVFVLLIIVKPNVVFFPGGDPNYIYVYIEHPIGTDATYTDSITKVVEKRVFEALGKDNSIVKSVISNVGIGAGDPFNPDLATAPQKGKVTVAFVEFNKRDGVSSAQYLDKIREKIKNIPGSRVTVEQEQNGPPVGKPVNIEIAGDDFNTLLALENKIRNEIRNAGIEGIEELKSDLQLTKPELMIEVDREKASREGVSTGIIAMQLRTALYGLEVSQFREGEDEYPIMVRLSPRYREKFEDLLNLQITYRDMATGIFRQIPLTSLAKVSYSSSYSRINRIDQQRVLTLSSNVLQGYNPNDIVFQVRDLISDLNTPEGYKISLTGEQEEQEETGQFLLFALFAAIGIIFLVLVTQFNSIIKPFIIFSTVVLSLIGVLLGFMVFNMSFSIVMTGVGIVALAGIVVKNGILLLEFIGELRERGYEIKHAVVEASATRLTPVLLTAASTVLGLVPLALGININFGTLFSRFDPQFFMGGDTATFWGPLAWAIIFGLTFSTFLTLIIVPSMYLIVDRVKEKYTKKRVLMNKS